MIKYYDTNVANLSDGKKKKYLHDKIFGYLDIPQSERSYSPMTFSFLDLNIRISSEYPPVEIISKRRKGTRRSIESFQKEIGVPLVRLRRVRNA
jgi:hypothetical protein